MVPVIEKLEVSLELLDSKDGKDEDLEAYGHDLSKQLNKEKDTIKKKQEVRKKEDETKERQEFDA